MPSCTVQSELDFLREAGGRLESATGELMLDFSPVRRIDAACLRELEQLGAKARERSVELVLRGVNVEVYKVLKLTGAANWLSVM